MRGAAIAFVGLVAIVASCSSYGEDEGETPSPAPADGGASSSGTTEAGLDGAGVVGLDGSGPDAGPDSSVGASQPPGIVRVNGVVGNGGSTDDQIELGAPVGKGNTLIVWVATSGETVKNVSIGGIALPSVATGGTFKNHGAWLKAFPEGSTATTVEVLYENIVAKPLLTVVELSNAGSHAQGANNGTGNVMVNPIATAKNDLILVSVMSNGSKPVGPVNAAPLLTQSPEFNGEQLLSAKAVATGETSPQVLWTSTGATQWDAIVMAIRRAP